MTTIIGEKDKFAVEYTVTQVSPHIFGHLRLWLNGYWIGCFDEEVMLDCSLGSLLELVSPDRQARLRQYHLSIDSEEQVMDLLMNDEGELKDNTMFNVDESTDDFIIHVYRKETFLKFLWKLCDQPRRRYANYPTCLLSAEIQFSDVQSVVKDFTTKLDELHDR